MIMDISLYIFIWVLNVRKHNKASTITWFYFHWWIPRGTKVTILCFKIHINKAEGQTFYLMTSKYTQYFRIRFKEAWNLWKLTKDNTFVVISKTMPFQFCIENYIWVEQSLTVLRWTINIYYYKGQEQLLTFIWTSFSMMKQNTETYSTAKATIKFYVREIHLCQLV